jgi:hypothetical protein
MGAEVTDTSLRATKAGRIAAVRPADDAPSNLRRMTSPTSALRSLVDPWYTDPLVPVLARRRQSVLDSLDADALVLTGPPAEWPAASTQSVPSVVTVGWLAAARDLEVAISQVLERLDDGGWLHVIEPTSGRPSLARAQRFSSAVSQLRTGWYLGRDIPGALRAAGLVVTDVERFSMPVSSTILQPWVQARARRRVTSGSVTQEGDVSQEGRAS